jgi:hypothetical protein
VDVFFNRNASGLLFSTGIIDVKGSKEFSDHQGLRACWGTDYPSTDTLKWKRETVGLAILIPERYIEREDLSNDDNYPFVIKTSDDHLCYKVCYTYANESFGYHTAKDWFLWLTEWKKEVERPVIIR